MAEYFGVLDKVNVQVIPTLDPSHNPITSQWGMVGSTSHADQKLHPMGLGTFFKTGMNSESQHGLQDYVCAPCHKQFNTPHTCHVQDKI